MITPRAVGNALRRSLSDAFHIAILPDHPQLLSAPSLLVGGQGRLTAIFLVGRSSGRNLLYARLASARLALPTNTRMVALLDDGADRRVSRLLSNFDLAVSVQEPSRSLANYCAGTAATIARPADLARAKRSHQIRYSTALQITYLRRRHELTPQQPFRVIDALQEREGAVSAEVLASLRSEDRLQEAHIRGTRVFGIQKDTRHSFRSSLLPIWTSGLRMRFALDAGVPYDSNADVLDVLLIDDWPIGRFDPDKPIRASAFSGTIVAIASGVEEIEGLIDRAHQILRKRLSERPQSAG
jgi:hypothetical protein